MKRFRGMRQIMVIDIESVQTSCGFAVPVLEFKEERQTLIKWAGHHGPDGLYKYHQEKNKISIDGLPARPFVVV